MDEKNIRSNNLSNDDKIEIKISIEEIHEFQSSLSSTLVLAAQQFQSLKNSLNSTMNINFRQFVELNQQTLKTFANEIIQAKKFYETNYLNGIKQQLEIFNRAKNMFAETYFTEIGRSALHFSEIFNSSLSAIVAAYQQQFRDANKILQNVLPAYVQQFEYIRKNLPIILENISLNEKSSFGFQLVESVGALELDDSESNLEKILITIQETIIEQCQKIKISNSTFNTIISLVLFLLSLIHSHYSSKDSVAEIIGKIENSKQLILSELEKIKPTIKEDVKAIYYVVLRPTFLFSNSNTKSSRQGILFPNTYLKVIVKRKKWLYIEYFDFVNGIPKYGWVIKKYCRIIH